MKRCGTKCTAPDSRLGTARKKISEQKKRENSRLKLLDDDDIGHIALSLCAPEILADRFGNLFVGILNRSIKPCVDASFVVGNPFDRFIDPIDELVEINRRDDVHGHSVQEDDFESIGPFVIQHGDITLVFESLNGESKTILAVHPATGPTVDTPRPDDRRLRLQNRQDILRHIHNLFADFILLRRSSKLPETLRTAMPTQPIQKTAP